MSLYKSRYRGSRILPALFNAFVRTYTRLKVEGAEQLPQEGSFIIAANHQSHADTAVIFAAVPKLMRKRFVAAAAQDYFFQGGPPQYLSRVWFNAIPIARDRRGGMDPLRHLGRALREGYVVMMFPEGTRSTSGTLGPFRAGIGKLIAEFPGTPVVPTWVGGTARILPKGVFIPRPFRARVRFGAPLQIKAHPKFRATWQSAADEIREAILQLGDYEPLPVKDSE
ncbi:lysophospholipid acyltransferase family protein [Candidatus Viridilinea mediisalina]|uniref:1-acyl-sn-glycerol-3-phosphate acyltransferase n=1 Tax=Candidatus Viridilinea mediisalina TaxID=2024553 RepID=A0A2A6RE44_9CHLR|nr:lysophospholipid acyltransferase family protein [Candidatus Viridilinea mediisalina]PDW00505.1 1-acyl-sn-glycerol-3-phosphate acyltransferase [Candidatus Viridilinea mediisalina]